MHITESIAEEVTAIATRAGALLMQHFNAAMQVTYKSDDSPVTQADIEANALIVSQLQQLTPEIPIVSEEADQIEPAPHCFWLVDPLDGTRAFIRNKNEFSVNIGLILQKKAIFGVLGVPAQGIVYRGGTNIAAEKISATSRQTIQTRKPPAGGLHVVQSSMHVSSKMKDFLKPLPIAEMTGYSSALKFGMVAEGSADIYPRFGRTMEWDTAAGQAIVEAAGGRMETLDGKPFLYGKPNYENEGFVLWSN